MDCYTTNLNRVLREKAYLSYCTNHVFNSLKDSVNILLRMGTVHEVTGHNGCVNTVRWNADGTVLLTGSDDKLLNIYKYPTYKLSTQIQSGHRSNIFSAKFLPFSGDERICSCSNDGAIIYNDINQSRNFGNCVFRCHKGIVFDVLVHNQDPYGIMSCGEDGKVRYFDLRIKSKCDCNYCTKSIIINAVEPINALAINPFNINEIAAGCGDGTIRVFDRRALFGKKNRILQNYADRTSCTLDGLLFCYRYSPAISTASSMINGERITCLLYNDNGRELLASYAPDTLVLFSTNPKRNISADDVGAARRDVKDHLHLLPGDLRNVNVSSKSLKLVWDHQTNLKVDRFIKRPNNPEIRAYINQSRSYAASSFNFNSDDQFIGFRRANEATSYEFGSEASPENLSRRNLSNDPDFSTETIPLLSRRSGVLNFNNELFDNTDPPQRNESTQDYDENPTVFGDASYPLRRMKRFLNVLKDESSGVTFDLPESMFYNLYDGSVVNQATQYDRLRSYLDSIFIPEYVKYYRGHGNTRTMIKECNFYGRKFIISGSDCGNVFAWDIDTCEVVNIFKADGSIVNSVQPHPEQPIIACSGIDSTTKIVGPRLSKPERNPNFDQIISSNTSLSRRRGYRFRRYDFIPEVLFQVLLGIEHTTRSTSEVLMQAVHHNDGTTEYVNEQPSGRESPGAVGGAQWYAPYTSTNIPAEYVQNDIGFSSTDFESNYGEDFDETSYSDSHSQSSYHWD